MNRFLVLFALLLAAAILIGGNWNNAAYENGYGTFGVISDATLASQIDDHIRAGRHETRARMEVEHHYGSDNADDTGLHRIGSGRCFVGNSEPTTLEPELGSNTDYDNTTNATFGAGEGVLANNATTGGEKVGYGRCWVDEDGPDDVADTIDDNTIYFHDGTDWVLVTATSTSQDDVLFGENLISNGSFEYGGTGVGGSLGATSTADPKNWTTTGSPTFTYSAVGASDDEDWGPGLFITATDSGAGTDSIDFALTDLRSNGVYKVVARVKDDGANACSIDILNEGGTAFVQQDSSAGGGWETLTGTFGTSTTALDDVDVELSFGAASQVCSWDHIAVYDQGDKSVIRYEPPNLSPNRLLFRNEDTRTSDCVDSNVYEGGDADCDDIVTVNFTPQHPGYRVGYIALGVGVTDNASGNFETCEIRLQRDGTDIFTDWEIYDDNDDVDTQAVVYIHGIPGAFYEDTTNIGSGTQAFSAVYDGVAVADILLQPMTAGTEYTFDIDMRKTSGGQICEFSTGVSNHFLEIEFVRADR